MSKIYPPEIQRAIEININQIVSKRNEFCIQLQARRWNPNQYQLKEDFELKQDALIHKLYVVRRSDGRIMTPEELEKGMNHEDETSQSPQS